MSYITASVLQDLVTGKTERISTQRNEVVVPMTRLVGSQFALAAKDTVFWGEAGTTGSGAVTQSYGQVALATGITADSVAQYQTLRSARYISGANNLFRGNCRVDAAAAKNGRRWGAYDANNGLWFEFNAAGALELHSRTNGSGSPVDAAAIASGFNGSLGATYSPDVNNHTYEIQYSNSTIYWVIDDLLLHKQTVLTTPLTATMNLPVTLANINSGGGTANTTLWVRNASILRCGEPVTEPRFFHFSAANTTQLKTGAGKLHSIHINTPGGATNVFTVYDGVGVTSAIIVIFTGTGTQGDHQYNVEFQAGLYIVDATGTACDATIVYE